MRIGDIELLDLDKATALSTSRLLVYFRKYNYTWKLQFECDCCHEYVWRLYPELVDSKRVFDDGVKYFEALKMELDKRENMPKKPARPPKPRNRKVSQKARMRQMRRRDPMGYRLLLMNRPDREE